MLKSSYLKEKGNAPEQTRIEIIEVLQKFQDGYTKRDTTQLESFMQELFVQSDNVLILGTEPGELFVGYEAATDLIRNDWEYLGNVSLEVDDAIVSASGDVAWATAIGRVGNEEFNLPLRFSAILVRDDSGWRIHQLQYQWDVSIRR